MIVVDTSVWIAHFRNDRSAAVTRFRSLVDPNDVVVGDIVMLECLQGARDERHAAKIEKALRPFPLHRMLGETLAKQAARHYRALRTRGVTPRKTVDVIIATYCIHFRIPLLHQDRDFQPFETHLGLTTL